MKLSKSKIKEVMENKGIKTFSALSKRIGITKNQLSVMLSDSYNPLKSRVYDLCLSLDVSPLDIMDTNVEICLNNKPIIQKGDVTAIELFAGAGGLALGLEQAGIKTLAYIEIDKSCCETLRQNRPAWNVICDDIHNVDFIPYNGVDIVTGGFPCQAFSYAGKQLGFEDTRGTLFHEFARCVKEVQPKMFLAENVRGLVSHDHGRTLNTILSVFAELGYFVQYRVLNACYYGVGQKRERLIIVGTRRDLDINFHYPQPDKEWTTIRQALKDCPASKGAQYSERKRQVMALVPPGGCWVDLPADIAREYMGKSYYNNKGGRRGIARRIAWDEPSLTLVCSPVQMQTERCHPDETRPFTVREYARIQSFPDDWQFCGGLADQYRQIGNAVPVELARRIGVQLRTAITNAGVPKELVLIY